PRRTRSARRYVRDMRSDRRRRHAGSAHAASSHNWDAGDHPWQLWRPAGRLRWVPGNSPRPEIPTTSTFLLTGARGHIGPPRLATLAKRGARARVLLRQPSPAFAAQPSIDLVHGSYDDAAAVTAAMQGVSRALFITAGPELARHDAALAAAAKATGVEHVV